MRFLFGTNLVQIFHVPDLIGPDLSDYYLCGRWYIGHTTTTVAERMKQHTSIKKHHKETHVPAKHNRRTDDSQRVYSLQTAR